MFRILRFLLVVVLAAVCISLIGRLFSDFDQPAEEDPHDLVRGIGVWVAAGLISVLNEMRLRPLNQMYDTFDVANAAATTADKTLVASSIPTTYHPVYSAYDALSRETNDYVLFVHGWRMRPWEKQDFANTAYRRLFWQGYKGRFGAFDWPTEWVDTSYKATLDDPGNFDRSEEKAFYSAAALNGLLGHLDGEYSNAHINLFAHSMGNIVAGEALRQAENTKVIHTYVASQAAFAANAYNKNVPWRTAPNQDGTWDTPDVYSDYPGTPGQAYFATINNAADSMVNFYNPVDYALNKWRADQNTKPDFTYWYAGGHFFFGLTPLDFPDNTYQIFAFAAQAHSNALGATANVGGPFGSQVDLQATFGFTDAPKDHSAEFVSSYAVRRGYWMTLLARFGL